MKTIKIKNKCRSVRSRLYKIISNYIGPDADWVQAHIATCPKCQARFASLGRVHLAISILKSQPHSLDLLKRANTQAIGVLRHGLREGRKADKLRSLTPEPKLLERCAKYKHSLANAAACILILFLMKAGIFSSADKFQRGGRQAMKQYYAARIGDDLANEIFTA